MTARDFEAAGLLDPTAPGAAERLALLQWLAALGATPEDMVEADRRGQLVGLAGDLVLRAGTRLTLSEVAARSGLDIERIERINRAAGFPPVGDERAFSPETADTMGKFAAGEAMFGEAAMLQFVRVVGSSVSRVAEAAIALFLAHVEAPLVEQGSSLLGLAEANLRAVQALEWIPDLVRSMFRAHVEIAIRRLRAARPDRAMHDTVHLTVGFVDLVGYTRLTQQLDARALGALVDRFEGLASDVVATHDGRVVKLIGDEVMFVAVDARAACNIALTLVERFANDPSVTPRGGLALGPILLRGGDYYGPMVNLASRMAELAVPHEILITAEVAAHAGSDGFRSEPAGRRVLKGFEAPIQLYTVARG